MSDINILFLTFNRLEYNKLSLPALLDSDPDVDYKVHIVDNGSNDGTVEYLKTLSHPKIGSLTFNKINLGISPITNDFWKRIKSEFYGKIDNDIVVPKGWIKEVMLRLEHAPEERIGPITLYHWIPEWLDDIDHDEIMVFTTKNGSQFVKSTHTGGNYIMHNYLIKELGPVPEKLGLKGGFTTWQYKARGTINVGYIYPLHYFSQPAFQASWESYKAKKLPPNPSHWIEKERSEAKRLLEICGRRR